jgi:hypothetical protein
MATPTSRPKLIEPHPSGWLDHVRTAIFALQLASELTSDENEIAHCREVIGQLQNGLAAHARRRDAAITTRLQHVDRVTEMDDAEVEARASALAGTKLARKVSRSTPEEVRDRMASHALED